MGSATTYNISPTHTFTEEVAGQLENKAWYLVERGATAGTVKILATAGNEIGLVREYDPAPNVKNDGTKEKHEVTVLLLEAVGKAKFKTSGAITYGDSIKAASGGTVVAAASTNEAIGYYLGPDAASGDIIEAFIRRHTVA